MNKKTITTLAITAFAVGGLSMVALQSRAQSVSSVPAPVVAEQVTATATSPADTDNIDNEKGGPEKVDAITQSGTDKETNDDSATSTVSEQKSTDTQEQDTANNPNEVEDGQ